MCPVKTTPVKPMRCEIVTEGLLWIDKIASGVGVILYNPERKVAGGYHVLRGKSSGGVPVHPAYYADTALSYVINELRKRGVHENLSVAVAGGASLLSSGIDTLGELLVAAVKDSLKDQGLSVKIERVGGVKLRSMILNVDEGKIRIS
ncbi:MAG TPA: hypothetical protein ENN34_08755 [Deltaproteobacteria bacterium]|nr:hypothetical protein [Deltaproteobacteria bacterium]